MRSTNTPLAVFRRRNEHRDGVRGHLLTATRPGTKAPAAAIVRAANREPRARTAAISQPPTRIPFVLVEIGCANSTTPHNQKKRARFDMTHRRTAVSLSTSGCFGRSLFRSAVTLARNSEKQQAAAHMKFEIMRKKSALQLHKDAMRRTPLKKNTGRRSSDVGLCRFDRPPPSLPRFPISSLTCVHHRVDARAVDLRPRGPVRGQRREVGVVVERPPNPHGPVDAVPHVHEGEAVQVRG